MSWYDDGILINPRNNPRRNFVECSSTMQHHEENGFKTALSKEMSPWLISISPAITDYKLVDKHARSLYLPYVQCDYSAVFYEIRKKTQKNEHFQQAGACDDGGAWLLMVPPAYVPPQAILVCFAALCSRLSANSSAYIQIYAHLLES